MNKIIELLIDFNNTELDELGVDIMSLVDKPAIGVDWMAFSEQTEEFASYNDYPEAVKEAAARGIRLNEEQGNKCATQTGKVRAQQLANGENISMDTIKRMYSYLSRAKTYYNPDDTEACGTISYLLWGGPAALGWSERKIKQEEEMSVLKLAAELGETLDAENTVFIDMSKDKFSTIGDYLKGVVGLDILGRRGLEQNEAETKYRFAGPPAERNFCKSMLRLNKFYTIEEIEQMSRRIDTGFRHNNQSYSIFDYKGGVNCKHYWEEVELYKEGRETVVIQKGRASGNAGQVASAANDYWRYEGSSQFAFSDDDEMIVVGPAMIPDQLILRKDADGNPFHVFFSKDTVKKIAEKFFKEMKHNNTDINHDDNITKNNTILESWIVEDTKKDKSAMYGFELPVGTWMTSYRINDEDTWNKIKAGELNGFSVTGEFVQKLIK